MGFPQNKEKQYYKTKYHPQYNLSAANIRLYNEILNLKSIETVFEFGCNIGRHLQRLQILGYDVYGMDINKDFVKSCILQEINVIVGDENKLHTIESDSMDLVFTNSVLCHMSDIKKAIKELKRITKRELIVCECINKTNDFWWEHDYEALGFKPIIELTSHKIEKAKYILYKYDQW